MGAIIHYIGIMFLLAFIFQRQLFYKICRDIYEITTLTIANLIDTVKVLTEKLTGTDMHKTVKMGETLNTIEIMVNEIKENQIALVGAIENLRQKQEDYDTRLLHLIEEIQAAKSTDTNVEQSNIIDTLVQKLKNSTDKLVDTITNQPGHK